MNDNKHDGLHGVLPDTRRTFAKFYEAASNADAKLMDDLAVARGALCVMIRESVRSCPTFAALSPAGQKEIERGMFVVVGLAQPADPEAKLAAVKSARSADRPKRTRKG